ncbi:MAG: alpha/beta fold hydrolase [Gammaproteobacteria bacterium]|nr:alpha/beta fold hydrolase [Gammaproteobacteria bacterium]
MNRARPLMAATAEALSARGLACCYFDLHGTGDSDGDFSAARWDTWLDDLDDVISSIAAAGRVAVDIIGVRLGALLALQYAADNAAGRLVLWDPVLDAGGYLDRFLLTRSMAAMMSGRDESVATLRQRLENGETLEVGGYALHPDMVAQLAALQVPRSTLSQSVCVISRSAKTEAVVREAGLAPDLVCTADYEPYWSAVEVVAAPGLVDATCDQLGAANA